MSNKSVKEIENSNFFATMFAEAESRDAFHVAGVKIEIAEQIYRMMEKRNITQSDLARKLGKNRAYISKILKGTTNFTIETLDLDRSLFLFNHVNEGFRKMGLACIYPAAKAKLMKSKLIGQFEINPGVAQITIIQFIETIEVFLNVNPSVLPIFGNSMDFI